MDQERLFLIDGSAMIYRSYFAFQRQPLINSKGEDTGAIFGVLKSLLKILDEEKPQYMAIIFDTPEPTFRHKLYKPYKATREKMPDALAEQIPRIKEMIRVLNLPIIEKPGYEADDVMGTFAKLAEEKQLATYLVTGDKDFMQLVSPFVFIYNPKHVGDDPEILDVQGVITKIGVGPDNIIHLMSLTGDTSDNIPGVRGIGPKAGVDLISKYGSLNSVYDHLHDISDSVRLKLESFKDDAYISRDLVTIKTDVDVDFNLELFKVRPPDQETAFKFFKDIEFNSVLDRFIQNSSKKGSLNYQIIHSMSEFNAFLERLKSIRQFTLDLETTSIDPLLAEIVGFSFSWEKNHAFYIPVSVRREAEGDDLFAAAKQTEGLDIKPVISGLRPILESKDYQKCGQNIKYDSLVLSNYDLIVQGIDFDTMVASYVINPSLRQHNLDALSLEYLHFKKIPTSDLIGKGKGMINMAEVPVTDVARYACEDADITQQLKDILEPKLKELSLDSLFRKVEIPLIEVLIAMERHGVSLDLPFLNKMSGNLDTELNKLIHEIYTIAGEEFNINSTKQLSTILFQKLKLPVIKKTKTGISTDVTVLEELAHGHELPRKLLEYRQLSKLKSTYVDALPKLVNPRTKRVHSSYNQTVTATGRLSSSDPNFQNIPIRTETGREIRRAFIPIDRDHLLLDADYSQIELRIMAHLSEDATLMNSFFHDEDVHRRTAALVFKVKPEQVDAEMRRKAKEVNFGIMYGMGPYGLSNRLGISVEEADKFITNYFTFYPKVKQYIEETISRAKTDGFVTTLLKRRRYLPEIHSDNRQMREFAERTAINTPIQGSAADLIKVAMINIHKKINRESLRARMIIQVHDELVFEVHRNDVEQAQRLIVDEMEHAIQLSIPIKVDVGIGSNWLEAH